MEMQACDSPLCSRTHLNSSYSAEKDIDCPICLSSLEDQEIAMAQCCEHVLCSECMRSWRGKSFRNFGCPCCRVNSSNIIFSANVFKNEQKEALFKMHQDCEFNDPILRGFLDQVDNVEWKTFIDFVLNFEERSQVDYKIDYYCEDFGLDIKYFCNKFITFESSAEDSKVSIIYLRMPGELDIQIMFTDQDLIYREVDHDFADTVVGLLNQQLRHSWKGLPNAFLNYMAYSHTFVRKFGNIHCFLGIELRDPEFALDATENILKDQIQNIDRTNIQIYDGEGWMISTVRLTLFLFEDYFDDDSED